MDSNYSKSGDNVQGVQHSIENYSYSFVAKYDILKEKVDGYHDRH